jgi:hypothetical protein
MRIARVEIDGLPRAAIVAADGQSVRVLGPQVDVLDLMSGDPRSLDGQASERALGEVKLLAPSAPRPSGTSRCSNITSRGS